MSNTQKLLDNTERRLVVSERICMQQETELILARKAATEWETTCRNQNKLLDKFNKQPWYKRMLGYDYGSKL